VESVDGKKIPGRVTVMEAMVMVVVYIEGIKKWKG